MKLVRSLNDREANGEQIVDDDLLVLLNANNDPIRFTVPAALSDGVWRLEIATADLPEDDIAPGAVLDIPGRTIALFSHGNRPPDPDHDRRKTD